MVFAPVILSYLDDRRIEHQQRMLSREVMNLSFLHAPLDHLLLKRAVHRERSKAERLASFLSGETGVYTTVTVGDLLYDWARISPDAVQAMDFARVADLADIFAFARFAQAVGSLSTKAYTGNIAQLEGYVAEQIVASILRAQGAEVTMPATPNQPGFDLIVNGQPVQVKCLADASGVHEHLARYPDIPVIVNEELALDLAGWQTVWPLPGLRHSDVLDTTERAIDAGGNLIDLQIPVITGAIAAGRNALALMQGQTDWVSAAENFAMDVICRSSGAKLGAIATAGALGVVGISGGFLLVVLPIFGAAAGYKLGQSGGDWTKLRLFCKAERAAVREALSLYCEAATNRISHLNKLASEQLDLIRRSAGGYSRLAETLIKDWEKRLQREIEDRQHQAEILIRGAHSPQALDPHGDLEKAAISAMLRAATAGLLPLDLPAETELLRSTAERLAAARARRLL